MVITSTANVDWFRELGADLAIAFNVEDFTNAVAGCDDELDTVGDDVQTRSYSVLRPGGRLAWGRASNRPDLPRRAPMSRCRARRSPVIAHLD